MSVTFAEIVETVHALDGECKEELAQLLQAWIVEERREDIRRNAEQAERDLSSGKTKKGGLDELMADLNGED